MGPIRPPSEAQSVLIRVSRNCPWNRCAFCMIYKGQKYERRRLDDVLADVRSAARGFGDLLPYVRGAFLQDADPLRVPTDDVVAIIEALRREFPSLERVTAYVRAKTLARKPEADLRRLAEAGLARVHIGLETGYGPLLKRLRKGATPEEMIDAGQKANRAGLSVSEYVMPGLGGRALWREHADATAAVLNAIDPDFIRIRTLSVRPHTEMHACLDRGEFEMPGEDEIVRELRRFIAALDGIESRVVSDHILNLLEDVNGTLPNDKADMLAVIDRYLALGESDKLHFKVGRRLGRYRALADMDDPAKSAAVEALRRQIEAEAAAQGRGLEDALNRLREDFI